MNQGVGVILEAKLVAKLSKEYSREALTQFWGSQLVKISSEKPFRCSEDDFCISVTFCDINALEVCVIKQI